MSGKDTHIEERIQKRNQSNQSLAEQMMIEAGGSLSDLHPNDVLEGSEKDGGKAPALPICWACNGKGKVEGLFGSSDCFSCDGTGYDLSDPLAIIKQQKEWLEWSRARIIMQRKRIAHLESLDTRTSEEKEADAVEAFYKHSKTNRND